MLTWGPEWDMEDRGRREKEKSHAKFLHIINNLLGIKQATTTTTTKTSTVCTMHNKRKDKWVKKRSHAQKKMNSASWCRQLTDLSRSSYIIYGCIFTFWSRNEYKEFCCYCCCWSISFDHLFHCIHTSISIATGSRRIFFNFFFIMEFIRLFHFFAVVLCYL